MQHDNLFHEEDSILSHAMDILKQQADENNSLYSHYSSLLDAYSKLLKQNKRIIRLSDRQYARLAELNRARKNVLDNIPVGILVIDKDGIILPMYSRYTHELFGPSRKIKGAKIESILYWEDDREKERATLLKWLPLVFDPVYDWDMIEGLGPDIIHHQSPKGDLYYRNKFHRIVHKKSDVFLLIYITDVSLRIRQRIALKEQETAHNFELEVISCFINTDNAMDLADFMTVMEQMVREAFGLFAKIGIAHDKIPLYNHMFRIMHSIKGMARTYGLNELGRMAHEAEDILEQFRSNEITFESGMVRGELGSEKLRIIIEKMKSMLKQCDRIINKIVNQGKENAASIRSRRRGLRIDEDSIDRIINQVEALKHMTDDPVALTREVNYAVNDIYRLKLQPLSVVYDRLKKIVKDVSISLGKQVVLNIEGDPVHLSPEAHHQIISAMIHMLRNSLDHGIESPDERSCQRKDPMGNIRITTKQTGENFQINIEDDGRGIDPVMIAEKAVSKKLVSEDQVRGMTEQQKLELILLPGFSTRDSVTELSGRGVGMDVVAEAMRILKGDLSLTSRHGLGTTIQMTFSGNPYP